MGKNKNKKGGQKPAAGGNSGGVKKTKNIFKVATSSGNKKSQRKTKEIPKKLKQLDLKTKADNQLKDLHLKMVSKKEKTAPKSVASTKRKGPTPNTKEMQDNLDKMNVN